MKRQRYVYEIFHAEWKYRDRGVPGLYGCFTEAFIEAHGSVRSVEMKYGTMRKEARKGLRCGMMILLNERMQIYVKRISVL